MLLGIGPDGHTASLFPGQPTLSERSRLVVGVPEAGLEPFVPRVSLTIPRARRRAAGGVPGRGQLEGGGRGRGLRPDAEPDPHVPASLLAPEAKQITVLLDHDAAAEHRPPR